MIPKKQAEAIQLLLLDVDGVLTDGKIILTEQGEEIKSFNAKDGHGLRMLMDKGIEVILITGRRSKAIDFRAKDLGILEVYQGVREKGAVCEEILRKRGLKKEQVCCVCDDLPDIPLIRNAGLSFAVSDASEEIKALATYVTQQKGGHGAVREVCDVLLASKGQRPFRTRQDSALQPDS